MWNYLVIHVRNYVLCDAYMKSIFLNKNIMIKSLIHFLFEFLDVIISSVLSLSQKIQG